MLEILISKRIVMLIYAFAGTLILLHLISTCYQAVYFYATVGEIDVSVSEYLFTIGFFFVPFWLVGALVWRAVIQRVRLMKYIKKTYRYTDYQTDLSPAEAGILVDGEFGVNEAAATLLDLHFRSVIGLEVDGRRLTLRLVTTDLSGLSVYESHIIQRLFAEEYSVSYGGLKDPRLISIFKDAHSVLIKDMARRGYIVSESEPSRNWKIVFRLMVAIAAIVSAMNLYMIFTDITQITGLMDPRYPLAMWQVVLVLIVGAAVMAVVFSGFWPKFSKKHDAFTDAVGFYDYMRSVYRYRLSAGSIRTQDEATVRDLAAYAVAFKIVGVGSESIGEILAAGTSSGILES